ncbi:MULTISPECIES: efflux RND transporter periplasmic adaptor subunit [unclassified Pseudoalteromonas]|uniref:efflux RND transporter periplasmic adaptor subunit n=1 Tax=unclassified Pseudoalteromonas TaxID=194690 RepID=UPI0010229292|nr:MULTISPECIES: efflux RND transporter periplasmic adaptor subunit [unclassified Pseudoalteromonas]MCG9707852.1 efflux RND transporter periplasmic adaptor subunit [Pseudoalteromonas sp. Isolate3]RZD19964.1 efflux RND transporter periplasmic adaptor subunit [Pseudoalteromonas sp. MEBiC 03485]
MYLRNFMRYALLCVCYMTVTNIYATEQAHNHQENEQAEHANEVSLTEQQQQLANIKVERLVLKKYKQILYAPGEIKANGYASYLVSPRVDSIVVKRHALLGQHVNKGDSLVTLFSGEVASQQTEFRLAEAELKRLTKMTAGTVSKKQILTAKAEYEVAYSRLVAFGLSKQAIAKTLTINPEKLGEYTLFAQTSGAVLTDNFAQGQRVDSGIELMLIADESALWVAAQLSANQDRTISNGSRALLEVNGNRYPATVIQEAHTIDEQTRSRTVRLEVKNTQHSLHPGMFADVYFQFETDKAVLAVPENALTRSADGDWQLFVVDDDGSFVAQEVNLGRRFGDYREVLDIQAGLEVVTQGAFFIASQLAKGGFDPHNH